MIVSRNNLKPPRVAVAWAFAPVFGALASAVVGVAMVIAGAAAQPVSVDTIEDFEDILSQEPITAEEAVTPDLLTEAAEGVVVGQLEALDPSAVGLLDEMDGGFTAEMWAGSQRPLIERLLPSIAAEVESPAMQSLMRRLLLTRAAVPEGPATVPSMLGQRVERLVSAGQINAVAELLGRPANLGDDITVARALTDVSLLTGDTLTACSVADSMLRRDAGSYWLKVMTFCRALDGNVAGAGLAVELLRESGEEDQAFFDLVDSLTGEAVVDGVELDSLDPLYLAMLRAAEQPIPVAAVEEASLAILPVVARLNGLELDARIEAAERAEMYGAMSSEDLGGVFGAIAFPPNELGSALSVAKTRPGSRSNALLYQVALRQRVPAALAEVMQTAWRVAEEQGDYAMIARVNLAATRQLEPAVGLAWLAPAAARALLIGGDPALAMDWLEVLRMRLPQGSNRVPDGFLPLWPLFVIADAEQRLTWPDDILDQWWANLADLAAGQRAARAGLVYTLLEVFWGPVPEENWRRLMDGDLRREAPVPLAPVWRGLQEASQDGRLGETVLFSLLALGSAGPQGCHPVVLAAVLRALRAVGLEAEARALALEALYGQGL